MGDPDSSFDICFYYTRDHPDEEGQDSVATPSNASSAAATAKFSDDVFKAFDESYDSSAVNNPPIECFLATLTAISLH
jgi:hypothetical protein